MFVALFDIADLNEFGVPDRAVEFKVQDRGVESSLDERKEI